MTIVAEAPLQLHDFSDAETRLLDSVLSNLGFRTLGFRDSEMVIEVSDPERVPDNFEKQIIEALFSNSDVRELLDRFTSIAFF